MKTYGRCERCGADDNTSSGPHLCLSCERDDELVRRTKERDDLVALLVGLFGWTDTSYLHAVLHVANAVHNLRATLETLKLQMRADYRLVHNTLLWGHEDHTAPLPPPWRGIAELVNEHQKLKLECECWRIMAAPGGGVGSFSQRLAVEKGDLAACREWAKKNDAFIEDLQKQAYSVREKVEAAVKAALEACAVECEKSESDNSWAYALRCRELDASAIVKRALGGEK